MSSTVLTASEVFLEAVKRFSPVLDIRMKRGFKRRVFPVDRLPDTVKGIDSPYFTAVQVLRLSQTMGNPGVFFCR